MDDTKADGLHLTQDQIDAALRKRPRFKLAEFVPSHAYKATGFVITLEREGVDRSYAIGVASKMFRIAKPQLRDLLEQADSGGAGGIVDMISDFHEWNRTVMQNRAWDAYGKEREDMEDAIMEIKQRLNEMLEELGHEPVT